MSRSLLHVAVFTALALAAPIIAGTAEARDSRGHRGEPVIEFRWGHQNVHDRGGRHTHRRDHGVSRRHIVRKLRRRGAYDISPVWRKRDTLRVEATNRRGLRARYVFDARTGELLRKRPLGWSHPRRHRSDFVIRGYF